MFKLICLRNPEAVSYTHLDVARKNEDLRVVAVSAGKSVEKLEEQIREFHPLLAAVWDEDCLLYTSTPDPTSAPASSDSSDAPDPTEAPSGEDDPASVAARYIGQSMSELENACGSPNGSDYEDEPESGKTGYYYYDTFTVSTTFDNDGNEVVSGVW